MAVVLFLRCAGGGRRVYPKARRVTMSDDWKGEDKISAKPKNQAEREAITRSAASAIGHRRRQKAGSNASRSSEPWALSISRWHKHGKIMRGEI